MPDPDYGSAPERTYLRFDPPLDLQALLAVREATAGLFATAALSQRYVIVDPHGNAWGIRFPADSLEAAIAEAEAGGFEVIGHGTADGGATTLLIVMPWSIIPGQEER